MTSPPSAPAAMAPPPPSTAATSATRASKLLPLRIPPYRTSMRPLAGP
eukprot:CAMPEP_0194267648 /NCGR_PEP_ID=MMETSP0169-20130528/2128_1 /TAXON_ID=218684 /ORGANISM="Corethron pennatum, Strain L29A3" /LENGTH=47 /DNA_ID= /DNA_START= /DNA_END= /DNA_ORIENTATION=